MSRGRLRRGVSLEVIVEEEDHDHSITPSSLLSSGEELTDGEVVSTDSNSSSPTPSSGGDNYGIDGSWAGLRAHRRGELGRARSVSCEALTVLDASDLETCEAEWNEGDTESLGRPVCVTFSGPISRRKILKARQAMHEDRLSGVYDTTDQQEVNYYNDTLALYDNIEHIREEQRRVDTDSAEEELHIDAEINEENEFQEIEANSPSGGGTIPRIIVEGPTDLPEDLLSDNSIEDDDNISEREEESLSSTCSPASSPSSTLSATSHERVSIHEIERLKIKSLLEPADVQIIEKNTPTIPTIREAEEIESQKNYREVSGTYTIRNKEVLLNELPPPHTVSQVTRLFEDLSSKMKHYQTYRSTGRFREIRSNPSSKILRFDRHHQSAELDQPQFSRLDNITLKEINPSKINNIVVHNSQQREINLKHSVSFGNDSPEHQNIISTSMNIDQLNGSSTNESTDNTPLNNNNNKTSQNNTNNNCIKSDKNNSSNNDNKNSGRRAQKTDQLIPLRKPKVVSGFNVKKALQENPRYFHITAQNHQTKKQHSIKDTINNNNTTKINNNNNKNSPSSSLSTNSNRKIKKPVRVTFANDEDFESLSSDTSDDSGVSNPSYGGTGSSSPPPFRITNPVTRHLEYHNSDPSFKWIDPAVLAKIRAVGTTVIFFGPRRRGKTTNDVSEKPKTIRPTKTSIDLSIKQGSASLKNGTPTASKHNKGSALNVKWRGGGDNTVIYNFTKRSFKSNITPSHLPEII